MNIPDNVDVQHNLRDPSVTPQHKFIARARWHENEIVSVEVRTDIREPLDPLPSSGSKIVEIAVSKPRCDRRCPSTATVKGFVYS